MVQTNYGGISSRRLYVVCAAVMLLLLLPCAAAADAISITTESDLRNVANDLTASYILENDITLTEPWTPIGTWTSSLDATRLFTGTFDGNGHTISNVSIVSTDTNGYVGFFVYASGATITNLTLADVNITGVKYVGGIAGGIKEGTVIDSCSVSGKIFSTTTGAGGIVGYIYHTAKPATVSNCFVSADIGSTSYGANYLGGIVGQVASSGTSSETVVINNCYYTGNIETSKSTASAGGILGAYTGASLTISNCYATGTISATNAASERVGGIVGYCSKVSLEISNCVAAQEYLNATSRTAPVMGYASKTVTYEGNYAYSGMKNGDTLVTELTPGEGSNSGDNLATANELWNTYSIEGDTVVWSGFSTDVWKPNMGNAAYKLPILKYQDVPVAGDASYLNTAGSGQTKPLAGYTKLLTPTPSSIWLVNEPVTLTASATVGDDLVFTWDMGNGDMVAGAETEYTYTEAGQYTVKLFVENDAGSVFKETSVVVYDMANPDAAGVSYTVLAYETVDVVNGSTVAQIISPISGGYRVGEDYLITPANSVGGMLQTLGYAYDIWRSQKSTPDYSLVNITVDGTLYPNGKYGEKDMSWRSYDGMTKAALKYDPEEPVPNGTTVYTVYCPHSIGASVGNPSGGTEYVIITKLNIVEDGAILPKEVTANLTDANIDLFNITVDLGDTSKTAIEIPENTPFGALYSLYANDLNAVVTDLHFWGGKYTSYTDWNYISLEDLNGLQHKATIDGVKYYWDGYLNGEKLNGGDLNPGAGALTGYWTALKTGDVVSFAYVPQGGDFSTAKELINITVTDVEETVTGPVELYNQTLTIENGSTVTAKISPISGGYKPGEDTTIEFSANTVAGLLNAAGIDYDVWKSQKSIPTYSLMNITYNGTLYANIQVGGDKCWRSFDGMTAAAKKYDVNIELPNGTTIYNVYGDHDKVNSDPSFAEYVIVTTINIEEPETPPSDPVASTIVLGGIPTGGVDLYSGIVTGQLIAVVKDENGADMTDETVNWTTSNATVLTIDATGKYTALAVGTANITATAVSNSSANVSATITVIDTTPGPVEPCITLVTGWNYISVPKTLAAGNNTAADLFKDVPTADRSMLLYDAENGKWISITGSEIIKPLNGYWIYSTSPLTISLTYPDTPTTPAVKTLYPGWNAIGLSSDEPIAAANALSGISWRTLLPWNTTAGKWDSAIIFGGTGANSPNRLMTTGNGYWLYVSETGTLTGFSA